MRSRFQNPVEPDSRFGTGKSRGAVPKYAEPPVRKPGSRNPRIHVLKPLLLITFVAAAIILASCSGQIGGVLREDGSADIKIQSGLLPSVNALIGTVSTNAAAASIFDANIIAKSIQTAAGVKAVSLRNITPSSIEGTINITQVNDFLAVRGIQTQQFIKYEQSANGGKLSITLDRVSAPQIMSLLSPDMEDYLSCLLSPGLTTDWQFIATKAEYLKQLRSTYNSLRNNKGLGNALASELQTAKIHLTLDFPRNISAAQGGAFSGKRAEFDIPLLDLLALETPVKYEVTWK